MNSTTIRFLLLFGIIIAVNIVGSFVNGKFDLTEEQRFTLTDPTKNLLKGLDDIVYVKVFLEGKFPAGFKRLRTSAEEMLEDFRNISPYLEYDFEDPSEGSIKDVNARYESFRKDGLSPITLRVMDNGEMTEKTIFPYALFNFGERKIYVNLLENDVPGMPDEVVLNNSIGLLEYKFANALQKLKNPDKEIIIFSEGHGELSKLETADLERSLQPYYNTGRVNLDSVVRIHPDVSVLVIAKPRLRFSEKNKFLIDQYVMNGGKVIWLIDRLNVNLDSMRNRAVYIPSEFDLNLQDQLFKYGARIEANLLLDLECSKIPLAVGQVGESAQLELFDWFYHPKMSAKSDHPIVKSLDRVNMFFPSSIDTIKTKTSIKKSILLTTSEYTRFQLLPVRLNFEILRYEVDPQKFDKGPKPVAVLLEGQFPSLFENRITAEMNNVLSDIGQTFQDRSVHTRMLVVSDGDIARNNVEQNGQFMALGYNIYERYKYANKDFLINAIEYLIDDAGVIESRSREVKLRLLNNVKVDEEKGKWQLINILGPLILIGLFGAGYNWRRKKKFAN